jgi:hypothetical protein
MENELPENSAELLATFQRINALEKIRSNLVGLLTKNKALTEAEFQKVRVIKEKFGITPRERSTKAEMITARASIRVALRQSEEPLTPQQVMTEAGLDDIDQVRRILRDEALVLNGPVKNILESRKDSRYYWDRGWRPPV